MAATIITEPDALALAEDPIYVVLQTDEIAGGVPLQENLLAYIEVWKTPPSGSPEKILSLHSPYNLDNELTTFDISKAFTLSPQVPLSSSIIWSGGYSLILALTNWTEYYLKYADKYGTPAAPETLSQTDPFTVIHGAQSITKRGTWNPETDKLILCHNYLTRSGEEFLKPIHPDQPDWIYFYRKDDMNIRLDVTFFFEDGSEATETLAGDPGGIPLTGNELMYVPSGYHQNNLNSFYPADLVTGYQYKILDLTGGKSLLVEYYFDCECYNYEEFFLMAFNGLGGCETFYLRGKIRETLEADKSEFERTRWTDFDTASGLQGQYNRRGTTSFLVATGFYPEYYIEHMKSLLLGDLWRVDVDNVRFLKMVIDTSSIRVRESDQQLFSLEFELRYAWADKYFTLY